MLTTDLLAAYDDQLRGAERSGLPAGVHLERDGPVARVVGHHRGFVSSPPDLGLDGPAVDALIARQRDFFAARGEAVEWKTRGHDRPVDLPDRLAAAGFVPEPPETVVVASARELAGTDLPQPAGVAIRSVSDEADLRRVGALESEIWGDDRGWLVDELIALRPGTTDGPLVLVAEAGDRFVAAAWLIVVAGTDFAGLWGGSTLPDWRGRGVYRALVIRRARSAAARGVRYLQVDASAESRPILQRLGFRALTTTTPYVWTPPV